MIQRNQFKRSALALAIAVATLVPPNLRTTQGAAWDKWAFMAVAGVRRMRSGDVNDSMPCNRGESRAMRMLRSPLGLPGNASAPVVFLQHPVALLHRSSA